MKRYGITAALAVLAISAGAEFTPVRAQQVVVAPRTYTYAAPAGTYYYPTSGYTTVRYRNRGILPGFSRRGGIGTTPYLGNSYGMGGYSTNYSAPAQVYTTRNYVYPSQTYVYPVGRGGWYR